MPPVQPWPKHLMAGHPRSRKTKPTPNPLILGSGDHTYELQDSWAKLPPNIHFGNTHAVQETADGRIIIHHTGHDSTCIFDPDGKFIEAWGGPKYAGNAHGMDLRKENGEEFLYLAPTGMHKVFKTDLKGNILFTLDYPKDAKVDGKPCYNGNSHYVPTFTALPPNGDFYVTDGYGSGFIHHYNTKGEYLNSFGGRGEADNQTNCPHGIYCDTRDAANPMILVADRAHYRLQYFTLDGKLDHLVINEKPSENNNAANGKFRLPCHFSQRGTEMLIPELAGRVTILDKDNNVIVHLGDNPNVGYRANNGVPHDKLVPGIFCTPHGATFDHLGNIYVTEWLPYGRVTKLRKV